VSCRVARPAASPKAGEKPHADGAAREISPTKDLRSSPYISTRRLAEIEARLDERDLELVRTVARFRVMSSRQLRELFFIGGSRQAVARSANRCLARLCDLGLLTRLPRRVGGVRAGSDGMVFALGVAAQRLLAGSSPVRRARSPHVPGARYLAHTLAVGGLYVALMQLSSSGVCELLAFEAEPECWREYPSRFGAVVVLKPDAALRLAVGEFELAWLVEVDLATESLTTIERKAQRHLDFFRSGVERRSRGIAPRVLWVVPSRERLDAIASALARLPASAREVFALVIAGEAAARLIAGVPA
jgi:Replication-relaxation